MSEKVGAVLVVGGGIAGVQSALDLADSGFKVYLVDSRPSIGGTMAQLDKTFPTNDCSMCILAPKLVSAARHPNIDLMVYSDLLGISGSAGSFTAKILKKARYVDYSKCTGCGACTKKCPVKVKNEFDMEMTDRKAIYVPFPQAVPLKYVRDKNKCIKLSKGKDCKGCTQACEAKAIKDDDKDETVEVKVGSVILTPGFTPFDPIVKKEYGYGLYPNVVTSMDFERILAPTGPYEGHILRPSDRKEPKRIAFVQCVGSRDDKTNPYCSSVCCMYSIKEAIIAKEHSPDLKPSIFFMDIRSFGKEFEYYYTGAEKEHGIRFVRSKIAEIIEDPQTKNLTIRYVEGKQQKEEEFDMVVLAVGLQAPAGAAGLAKTCGIALNGYSFAATKTFSPLETNVPGIFVAGAFSSPKDIPDSVAQSSGAAAKSASIISSARGTLVTKKEFPAERDISKEEPRIGVFVCHCGINIAGVVDVPSVVEYAKTLPNVAYVENNLFTCSQDTQKKIKEMVEKHKLNRVVVAACTPRTHEPLFRETCRDSSLNPYLFEMANIRDQCSWVHMNEKPKATKKSKDLVRMAVAKSRLLEPLSKMTLPVTQSTIVVGGGLSGMTSALELASQGFEVHLVEKEKELGGNLRHIHYILGAEDPQKAMRQMIDSVKGHKNIRVHLGQTVADIQGFVGNYRTKLSGGQEIKHGVFVIAVGAREYKPQEYLYGKDSNVMTQVEFEEKVVKGQLDLKKHKDIVMIQCVGSRTKENPACSRICCAVAIKNALKAKEQNPAANVYVLYKDIRTYGFREDYYRSASEKGVVFIRYDDNNLPVVEKAGAGGFTVKFGEQETESQVTLHPSLIVLSTATVPNHDNEDLAKMLKVPINRDGYFLEAHMKLRPVDFATEGVFLAGMAHSPKFIDEAIGQACAAASRAATVISKKEIELEATISRVIEENCDGCAFCVETCPYKAIKLVEYKAKDGSMRKKVEVTESDCKGCGCCMATCPKKGIYVRGFRPEQINAMVDAALKDTKIQEA